MKESKLHLLSEQTCAEIDHWSAKFPADKRRSAAIIALRIAQKQHAGSVNEDIMDAVAEYLQIPAIFVYEVATFYDMIELDPVGNYKIALCTNLSCQLRGSDKIVAALHQRLGIGLGETTADGMITLKEVECMAACDGAPMCQLNDEDYITGLTAESVVALVDKLYAEQGGTDE